MGDTSSISKRLQDYISGWSSESWVDCQQIAKPTHLIVELSNFSDPGLSSSLASSSWHPARTVGACRSTGVCHIKLAAPKEGSDLADSTVVRLTCRL